MEHRGDREKGRNGEVPGRGQNGEKLIKYVKGFEFYQREERRWTKIVTEG